MATRLSYDMAAELDRRIAARKLDVIRDQILSNADECLALVATGTDDYASVGNTRFGGEPDLPRSFRWPCSGDSADPNSRFSNFIGQINFAELPSLSSGRQLPKTGILYLFVRYIGSAAEPVLLDSLFFDGDIGELQRMNSPESDRLADEYLTELEPVKVRAVPAVSLATYRKSYRRQIQELEDEVDGEDGWLRYINLESDLCRPDQIGQLLGFANAGHEDENLYRQVGLARLNNRELVYNDYWDSLEEYEVYMQEWRDRGDFSLVRDYEEMRTGVNWLVANQDAISREVDQWRLLLRLNSNSEMNLIINDYDPLYVFIRENDLSRRDFSDLSGEVTQG